MWELLCYSLPASDEQADGGMGVAQRVQHQTTFNVSAVHVVDAKDAIVDLQLAVQEGALADGGDVDGLVTAGYVVTTSSQVQAQIFSGAKAIL